ncbi:sodium-dependent glucose transporter 1A-like [Pecten maximus]|uniref:sodium-dependent glucose transporter 1A-like n=1 Tax=Pecten maximus TaxID=6579 RepID=UPI0014588499|nr:sodium-dependent glucose transporter 1A-like [Pecten maximus]
MHLHVPSGFDIFQCKMSERMQKEAFIAKPSLINTVRCNTIEIDDATTDCCELAKVPKGREPTSFIRDIKNDKDVRFKLILSICVSLAFMMLGWTLGQMGPAFPDLLDITRTDLEKGSTYLTSYSTGRLVGSVLGGLLYSKINTYLLFVASLVINGTAVATIPWCSTYELMMSVHAIQGISGGVLNLAVTSTSMSIWGPTRRGRSYIQILYVFFSFSTAMAPIATAPFLRKNQGVTELRSVGNLSSTSSESNGTIPCCSEENSNMNNNGHVLDFATSGQESRLYIAFFISAGMTFLVALLFIILYIKRANSSVRGSKMKALDFIGNHSRISNYLQLINVGLLSAMFNTCQVAYPSYLTVFCVQYLHQTKTFGAMLTSVTVFITVGGRLIGIFLVRVMESHTILLCSAILYASGFICLTVSAHLYSEIGIWVSACLIGLPSGTIWPTALSWTNSYLITVDAKVSSYLNLVGHIGPLTCPFLLGYLMQEISFLWFCYVCIIFSALIMISSIGMVLHTKIKPSSF